MLRAVTVLLALAAGARACDVCVAGACRERRTLLRGFAVTDQMALDRASRVLYVQVDHYANTAYDLRDFTIERVQMLNTSGLTVDQRASELYTADHRRRLYRYSRARRTLEVVSAGLLVEEADLMFHKDVLYYTTKCCPGLHFIQNGTSKMFNYLADYTITDFVVDKNDSIYFVSDDKVYVYHKSWARAPEVVAEGRFVLSADKFGAVYLGAAAANGVYRLDEARGLVAYAAYTSGSVDRFVFDHQNDIVFHDPVSDTVAYWKSGGAGAPCALDPPHDKFIIKNVSERSEIVCLQPHEGSKEDKFIGPKYESDQ